MEDYAGKICPICKQELIASDNVKVCPDCGIPHHKGCWKKNGGCSTFGCSQQGVYNAENDTSICPKCGAELEDGHDFCPKCGTPRSGSKQKVCSRCGAVLSEGQEFCPKCGQKAGLELDGKILSAVNGNDSIKPKKKGASKAKIIIIPLLLIILVSLAVGVMYVVKNYNDSKNGKYYQDTVLKKFKTFTSITGIELSGTQDKEGGKLYTYVYENDAQGMSATLKWTSYIKEYGFEIENEVGSEYGITTLTKDGTYRIVISEAHPQDGVIMYSVFVPTKTLQDLESEEAKKAEDLNSQREEEYQEFVELCKAGQYKDALEFLNNSNLIYQEDGYIKRYSDTRKYEFYCEAMQAYIDGYYTKALEAFSDPEDLSNFLDSADVIKKIKKEIKSLVGTWERRGDDLVYYALSIKQDGSVGNAIDSKSPTTVLSYSYKLVKTQYYGRECWALGMSTDDIYYVITNISSNSMTVKKAPGSDYDTMEGTYEKKSSSTLKEK